VHDVRMKLTYQNKRHERLATDEYVIGRAPYGKSLKIFLI